ncbi:MAG TPA: type II secretion system F family protein [Candidatus Moranbacteria bacterium]|jgi:type IV pilus assembly protein PilC|nr:type II secretion system F family protein [Candidatus Moranbacteria bacterium]HQB59378.1 type II secretion system F family protein [Candidatus Moranbacteria bacterium]
MPKFIYTAKGYDGETKGGEIVAQDEKSLAQQLRSEGFLVTSITKVEEEKKGKTSANFLDQFESVPLKEKMIFARNLGVMFSSGLTVSRAVNNLALQTQNKKFRKILLDIHEEIQAGKSLSEGLAKHVNVFGELFVNMVSVGETAGNLDEVLRIVAVQLEKEHDLKSKVKGAMVYPAVILTVMFVIGIIMLTFVLPKLTAVFKDMGTELPVMTQVVIKISDALRNHGLLVAIGLIVLILFGQYFFRQKTGKKVLSWISIKFPLFSPLVKQMNCARFARIYSSLLKSGVGAVDALKIISHTLTNYYYQKAILGSVEDIQRGVALSKILADHQDIFPIMVSQIVEVGEETGKTESVLLQLAEFYEAEVDQITKNLSSIIEPLLMVVIGASVGFFAVAMLMPMYSMMDTIK